jgi:hypothetical protein
MRSSNAASAKAMENATASKHLRSDVGLANGLGNFLDGDVQSSKIPSLSSRQFIP